MPHLTLINFNEILSNFKPEKIFSNLKGVWEFSRVIRDLLNQTVHYASGEVAFTNKTDEENVLYYEEKGLLELSDNQRKISFHREYIFRLENESIVIIFNDGLSKGKLYQKLIPQGKEGLFLGTEHLCVLDNYQGVYNFPNELEFSIIYQINGPEKKWQIESNFIKK